MNHSSDGALKPIWGYKHSVYASLMQLCGPKPRSYIMQEIVIEEQKTFGNVKCLKNHDSVLTNLSVFAEGFLKPFQEWCCTVLFYHYFSYGGIIYRNTLARHCRLSQSVFQVNMHGDPNREETKPAIPSCSLLTFLSTKK